MRTEKEMEEIIHRHKARERRRQILLMEDSLKQFPLKTPPMPVMERAQYYQSLGKNYLKSKIKYV